MSRSAEQSVLGGLLMKPEAFDEVSYLQANDFNETKHRRIYKIIYSMMQNDETVDPLTVNDRLADDGDLEYITSLVSNTPSVANISSYARLVRQHAQRRGIAIVATEMRETVFDGNVEEVVDKAQAQMEKIMGVTERNEPVLVADDLSEYLDELEKRSTGTSGTVIPTGFVDLDKKLSGGLRGGDLVTIAARPKMGKTTFAMNIALNVAREHNVLFLSQEMKRRDLHDRNVAKLGKIKLGSLLNTHSMSDDEWGRVPVAINALQNLNLYLDDQGGLSVMDVKTKTRATKRKGGLDLLVIDYLQLMRGTGDSRNNEIESITRSLKAFALEMDIPILLLSQLNRSLESRTNRRPIPSDLRDSGAIEQDSDVVIFLYRDEVYNPDSQDRGICEVDVNLQRQGETGVIGLHFEGAMSSFSNLERGVVFGQSKSKVKYSGFQE